MAETCCYQSLMFISDSVHSCCLINGGADLYFLFSVTRI